MKQIEISQENKFLIKELSKPHICEHEVLIKVKKIALCGSDLHLFEGTYGGPKNYPVIFGHEWSGEIVQTGSSVTKVSIGDQVTGDCSKYCGECDNCRIDKNLCREIEKFGITVDGASSEYIKRDEKYVYPVKSTIDLNCAALVEPLSVSLNLLKRISCQVDKLSRKKILVIGMGGIGLGALLLLKYVYGCSEVFVADISGKRSALAEELGGTIVDIEKDKGCDTYTNMYQNNGYDVVIDTTGSSIVFKSIFEIVNPFGIIGCLGMLPSAEIAQKLIVLKALTVIGSIGGTGSFSDVLNFIERNQSVVKRLVSHEFTVKDEKTLKEAFQTANNPEQSVKVILDLSEL